MATDNDDFGPPNPLLSHVWMAIFAITMVLSLYIYVDDGEWAAGLMTVGFASMLADVVWRRHFADRRRADRSAKPLSLGRFHSPHRPNIQRQ